MLLKLFRFRQITDVVHHADAVTQTAVWVELLDDVIHNDELGWFGVTVFAR